MQISSRGLNIALAVLAALLLLGATIIFKNVQHLRADARLVDHTREVLRTAAGVRADMLEAEVVQGNFLASGDEGALGTIDALHASALHQAQELQRLTLANPQQQAATVFLVEALLGAMHQLDRVAEVRRTLGEAQARAAMLGDDNAGRPQRVRELLAQVEVVENSVLSDRQQAYSHAYAVVLLSGAAAVGAGLAAIGVFGWLLRRHLRSREAAAAQEKHLARTLESLDEGFLAVDGEWRIVAVNTAAARSVGRTRAQLLGRGMWEAFPALLGTPLEAAYRRAAAERVAVSMEHWYEPGQQWFHIKAFPAPEGGLALVLRDVTVVRRAEQALRESEERFRALFESMDEGFCVIEMLFDAAGRPDDYRFVELNPAFAKHTGLQDAEGRTARELVPGLEPFWFETYGRVALTGVPERFSHDAGPLAGRWFDVYAFRLGGEDSRKVAVLFSDISLRKQAERQREELLAQLQDQDRRKDEFLAVLAHELRNPLAPLRTGLELLKRAGTDARVLERSRTVMERQLVQMVRLIDELMDVSRISRGKIELRRQRVRLADVLQQAVETSRPLIDAAGHALQVQPPPEPLWVDADPVRLAQVFANLLNNAAKYTDPGGRIDVAITASPNRPEAAVVVRDTGVGIPGPMLARVFDLFTQVDRSLERSKGGLGIGLSLARKLVEMHGGRLAAHSAGQGRGSEFTVHLPLVAAPQPPAPVPRGADAAGGRGGSLRVLVADDNQDAANSLATLLEVLGHEVEVAGDGVAAIAAAAAFGPQLVLLDIGMPRMDGYEACRRLRALPGGADMLVAALTGWGQPDDRRRSREAGFDHHLVKPAHPAALEDLIAEAAERVAAAEPARVH